MDIDLTPALIKTMGGYPRTRGRYSASELYGILAGYTTPDQWLHQPPKSNKTMMLMFNGIVAHEQVQKLLEKQYCEIKKEVKRSGITLVGKVDYLPPDVDEVWEFKSSMDLMDEAKKGHEFQAKLYCTMFERPTAVIFQPRQNDTSLWLKRIGEVRRDDDWFDEQVSKLLAFHLKVEKLWQTPSSPLSQLEDTTLTQTR